MDVLFVVTIFNEGAYLTFKSIFNKTLKDGFIFYFIFSWERASIVSLLMLGAKQVNYWHHFSTSLVWCGPWLRIEPGTSRTRSQHSTTRLSRRQWKSKVERCNLLIQLDLFKVSQVLIRYSSILPLSQLLYQ